MTVSNRLVCVECLLCYRRPPLTTNHLLLSSSVRTHKCFFVSKSKY
uniref:Uncharacterized protein n=1 Tax=Anguilla anguilla TaxID=7936 RepID=A0A0E9PIW8_ANGAN